MFSLSIALVASIAMPRIDRQKPEPFTLTLPKSVVELKFMPIPAGSVKIGGKDVEVKPFFMAATETPWEAFDLFLLSGPPTVPYDQTEYGPDAIARPSKSYILPDLGWGHRGYPVINVSSDSVMMFCRWLSKETGHKYRVPTEAEWEFACRAGTTGTWKLDAASLEKQSWNRSNSDRMTHPVGTKTANAYGLFDMLGNVGEWATDLKGEPVLCGATHLDTPDAVSPSVRKYWSPAWQESDPQLPKSRWWLADGKFVGFRLVREG